MEISTPPRRFHLVRHRDVSGVSGTGIVAEGAIWSSGAVALHWPGRPRATSVWASLDDLRIVHGHEGATEVRFLDTDVGAGAEPYRSDSRGWIEFDGAAIDLPDERPSPDPHN
ncbi:hypothetical protein GCM10029976_046240 [Kribbella albertanoniae]